MIAPAHLVEGVRHDLLQHAQPVGDAAAGAGEVDDQGRAGEAGEAETQREDS